MKVWDFHEPKGEYVRKRWPRADHPDRFVSFVFVDVSSINTSRANALLKKGLRRPVHSSRARAISGRCCSLAIRLFFMAQPQPMEKPSDTGAMDDDATPGKFHAKFVQGQFAILCQPLADPAVMRRKLATAKVSLPAR